MSTNTFLNEKKAFAMDARRAAVAEKYLRNDRDDGRFGRAFELACARRLSNKTSVSKQGATDVSIKFRTAKGFRYIPVECKTNGGRVDDLISGSNKSRYVVYMMDTTQRHKATKTRGEWVEIRRLEKPVIIPTELFIEVLKRFNALKEVRHNGVVDGIAIQVSSKKLYQWLQDYPVTFDRDSVYSVSDFEELE